MGISINIQRIQRAKASTTKGWTFSTVRLITEKVEHMWDADTEVNLFFEGPGHEDTAARIAALINEQVIRRDTKPTEVDRDIAAEDEAAYEQECQEEEQAEEKQREERNRELGPRVRDQHHQDQDSDVPF
jgi:hypothetical protein